MTQTIKFVEEYPVALIRERGRCWPILKIGRIAIVPGGNGRIKIREVDSKGNRVRTLAVYVDGAWMYNPSTLPLSVASVKVLG